MSSSLPFQAKSSSSSRLAPTAVLASPRRFEVRSDPLPQPQPHQVRIRMEGCGVCGSNLPVWEGREWFDYPLEPGAPGHEGWGIVDQIGADVHALQVGQRVACLSYHAFAAYDIADALQVAVLPDSLADVSFPAEPLACAINVFRRCRIEKGESVAVIGIGFLGALLIQLAVRVGARVTAISRRPFALDVAGRCGASEVVSLSNEALADAHYKDGFSCVVEATGTQTALDLATQLVGVRGRLVVAGYHQDGPRQVNMQQWNWKGIDVVNAHERDPQLYVRGMQDAIQAVASGAIVLDELITHEFPLSEINEAFAMATERPPGFLKAIVKNLQEKE